MALQRQDQDQPGVESEALPAPCALCFSFVGFQVLPPVTSCSVPQHMDLPSGSFPALFFSSL